MAVYRSEIHFPSNPLLKVERLPQKMIDLNVFIAAAAKLHLCATQKPRLQKLPVRQITLSIITRLKR
jgi:hypothetical protein